MDWHNLRVLIVGEENQETNFCNLLQERHESRGCYSEISIGAIKALTRLKEGHFDVTILDVYSREKGIKLTQNIKIFCPNVAIVVMSAIQDLNFAVEVMKAGAVDYVIKPVSVDKTNGILNLIMEKLKQITSSGIDVSDKTIASIEAIAIGVEARQEILDVHTDKIIHQTANVARKMGFSEEKIQKWASARSELRARKSRMIIDSILQFTNRSITKKI